MNLRDSKCQMSFGSEGQKTAWMIFMIFRGPLWPQTSPFSKTVKNAENCPKNPPNYLLPAGTLIFQISINLHTLSN